MMIETIANVGVKIDKVTGQGSGTQLSSAIPTILSVIIGALALVAVVVIVIGGVNYMTSVGDSSKVEKAKKTILYACIGLIVCALSFAIVNWVAGSVLGGGSGGSGGDSGESEEVDYDSIDNDYACVQQGGEWKRGSREGSGSCVPK